MPVYEYYCPKCEAVFELRRSISEMNNPAPCPKCGTQGKKLVSEFGSKVGFYVRAPSQPAFRKMPEEASPSPNVASAAPKPKPKTAAKRKTTKKG